jgi:HTH-type transcriptional regulator/antitoxin HipB
MCYHFSQYVRPLHINDEHGEIGMDGALPLSQVTGESDTDGISQPARPLGQYVRARRRALGLSQSELGARCRVSQKTISLIESGETQQPRLELLDALASALGTSRDGLERLLLNQDPPGQPLAPPLAATFTPVPRCGGPTMPAPLANATPSAATSSQMQARALIDTLLVQAVNHPSDNIVGLVRQTAAFLAAQYGSHDPADRPAMELAIDSAWIVGRTYANVMQRQLHDGDAYFDHAATLAMRIKDADRWAQAVWRKANHHRKLDDLLVARDRPALHQARASYDLALIWLEDVLASGASAAWRSVAHAEYAKIAISTNRETVFAQHIAEAQRLAALASASEAPDWPPFLPEYAEVLWRDRYLLGMAVYNAGTEAEMGRLIDEARQFRNGLTAPFDRVMLPLSQTLRDLRSTDQQERERGAMRGWRVIVNARGMGLENFVRLAVRALTEAGLLDVGRRLYEAEVRTGRGR